MAKKKTASLKLEPMDDRVVARRMDAEEKTPGGIILPDAAQEKSMRGEIVAVGPGKLLDNGKRVEPDVKVGDIILMGRYAGTEVTVDEVEYIIMREGDILAKIS
ncbi:MAG: co-chaperone GroES [Planctomycetes bacterium]|nr:co-chaperone GroES [Planctomycetota bacterium]